MELGVWRKKLSRGKILAEKKGHVPTQIKLVGPTGHCTGFKNELGVVTTP